MIVGVRPILYDEDPYVGFSSNVPLFVEHPAGSQTVMVTGRNKLAWFNSQHFLKQKPNGAFRIFCLGGSTTYGRPYDDATSFAGWLREFLPAADPSKQWEVVNAGGISYASYRVAKLMEELVRYEPDLFIVYTGHNEFLERRTYGSLFEAPAAVDRLRGPLGRTRTYSLIRRLVRSGVSSPTSGRDRSAFELPEEVDTLLDQSVGPEAYTRDDDTAEQILRHFRFNLRRMIEIAASAGADVILVTPASNLRDSSPFKSEAIVSLTPDERGEFERLFQAATDAFDGGDAAAALQALDQAQRIDARFAGLQFLRGRVLLELSRPEEAKAAFLSARDEDVCPLRALSATIQAVRAAAVEADVPLVDFVELVGRTAENGLPGSDLFLDHVHPTIAGHRLLAEVLVETMHAEGLVSPDSSWGPATRDQIAARIEAGLDSHKQGIALRNLAKVLGWAGKLEEAARLAQQAVELIPDDAEAQFEAGISAEDRNDLAVAELHYRRARELAPHLVQVSINLGVVLARQERLVEAADEFLAGLQIDPQSAVLYANLARVKALEGDFPAAVSHQQAAVRYAPPDRRPELERTLAEFLSRRAENE